MDGRLSLAEAEQLVAERLGATPRAAHSRFVGLAMGQLAQQLDADAVLSCSQAALATVRTVFHPRRLMVSFRFVVE